ncbi:cupin domain-containing protein [Halostella sp. JP-L12]|uniref:cupin domain-containing protein n=1 Tax=Halostella TaxID=1843185 RepID=UPI000EF7FEF6|nr:MULTISPECIES: cupin domain-containing protein [Halostella]NHN49463.1 cupin domain-containing protein [Halostella sp. JP-L12]
MSHTKVNSDDVDPVGGGLRFLRDPLDAENLGLTVVEVEPGWTGKEHDHADEGHEEIYYLVEGSATVTIDGEDVDLESGDAVRISPDASRRIRNGDEESTFVMAGAP